MTQFESFFSKLSENHKIVELGRTEFKLWQLKVPKSFVRGPVVVEHISTAVTLVSLIRCQQFYDFLKA